jgi:hypothetical protein
MHSPQASNTVHVITRVRVHVLHVTWIYPCCNRTQLQHAQWLPQGSGLGGDGTPTFTLLPSYSPKFSNKETRFLK